MRISDWSSDVCSSDLAGEASYAAKAMVNVPIVTDKLAVRLVALQRYDAGYLDNTLLGEDGSNDLRVRGLRGSIVFTRSEEHTSELQSLMRISYAVFCLKKKINRY